MGLLEVIDGRRRRSHRTGLGSLDIFGDHYRPFAAVLVGAALPSPLHLRELLLLIVFIKIISEQREGTGFDQENRLTVAVGVELPAPYVEPFPQHRLRPRRGLRKDTSI